MWRKARLRGDMHACEFLAIGSMRIRSGPRLRAIGRCSLQCHGLDSMQSVCNSEDESFLPGSADQGSPNGRPLEVNPEGTPVAHKSRRLKSYCVILPRPQ